MPPPYDVWEPARRAFESVRSTLAGWVQARLVAAPRSRLRRRAYLGIRAVLAAHGDPPVRFRLGGLVFLLPLSHDLPLLRAQFPLYCNNLARLAGAVAAKYPDLSVVDVGANVGDSAALIRSATDASILCVEGNPSYLRYLRANASELPGVSIAPVFVAATAGKLLASVEAGRGTGRLRVVEGTDSGQGVDADTLDHLLVEYPPAGTLKLLKSDTDGFEAVILMSAFDTLTEHRPVLFFEYDPSLLLENGIDGLKLLRWLRGAGYKHALLYDNFGDLMFGAELDDRRLLEEVHAYFTGRHSERYLDIAAFHGEDADLYQSFRTSELDFYRAARSGNDS